MVDSEQFAKFVDHWVPEGQLKEEPFANKLVRALLNAAACIASQKEALEGKTPLRPLSDFPENPYPEGGPGF